MISRRALLPRLALLATGGAAGLWLVRDRLPWPSPGPRFANGRDTPWQPLPERGGLIEIPVSVNGVPLRAVVDSGAQITAIDATIARRLGLSRTVAAPMLAYGVSGGPTLAHTVNLDLTLPGLAVPELRVATVDLVPIAAATGRDFQLLIGRDVLRRLIVEADFPLGRVRFLAPGAYRPPRDAVTLPLRRQAGAPITAVQVEAAPPINVLVDTGSSGLLALSEQAATRAGLLAPGRRITATHSISLGGLALNRLAAARTVRLSGLTLRNVGVQIYRPAVQTAGPSGLLGTGLFRRYRMALDLAENRLFLVPPSPRLMVAPPPRSPEHQES